MCIMKDHYNNNKYVCNVKDRLWYTVVWTIKY